MNAMRMLQDTTDEGSSGRSATQRMSLTELGLMRQAQTQPLPPQRFYRTIQAILCDGCITHRADHAPNVLKTQL
jgi:hypothetical protein